MTSLTLLGLTAALTLASSVAFGDSRPPTTAPAKNGWTADLYDYTPVPKLVVQETTPSEGQLSFDHRPPQMPPGTPAPIASKTPAKPVVVGPVNIVRLRFRDVDGDDVPCLLCTPKDAKGPFPLAVALHGLGSNKAQVCGQVAGQLARHGFATLAFDLPLHGERPGEPRSFLHKEDLAQSFVNARKAVVDARMCIDLARQRPELDVKNGVVLVGYSLGSIIDSVVGPSDDRVKAMCLMVGGTPEFPPIAALVPQLAAMQPQLAIPHFAGRPLLMLNGKLDLTVNAGMATRLFQAAAEPKEQVWLDSGHFLPAAAYEQAAAWVAKTWESLNGPRKDR